MEEKKEKQLSVIRNNTNKYVLNSVENGCLEPELLARRCCEALERINDMANKQALGVLE
ncbi:hypothetical protein [Haemophilus influenzae]|uniref:hypothetical protein n=1 Tax=Haemophilus influenzae TaxID=727 RepID=UPI00014FCFD5|nr:hypothetical protein [Haemophilus influenzae]EDK06791.1 hypothetical protein CGSHiAA_03256 [Haemophilus influenzae PittAA]